MIAAACSKVCPFDAFIILSRLSVMNRFVFLEFTCFCLGKSHCKCHHWYLFPLSDSACICDQTFSQCFIMPRDRKLCGLPLGMSLILWISEMERRRAIDDYEPGPVPPQRPVDRFGFIKQDVSNTPDGLVKSRLAVEYERYAFSLMIFVQALLVDMSAILPLYVFIICASKHYYVCHLWLLKFFREARRVRKWRKMIGVGGSDWKHYARRKPHVVKRRIRKGIPDCLRGLVWQLISGSRDLLLMNPGVYEVLLLITCRFAHSLLTDGLLIISECYGLCLTFIFSSLTCNVIFAKFSNTHGKKLSSFLPC